MGTDYRLIYAKEWQPYESTRIQPAEAVLVDLFKDFWPTAHMLDLGVGTGRTTSFFSRRVASYTGIDSVAKMVEICQKSYPDNERRRTLLGDASCSTSPEPR